MALAYGSAPTMKSCYLPSAKIRSQADIAMFSNRMVQPSKNCPCLMLAVSFYN